MRKSILQTHVHESVYFPKCAVLLAAYNGAEWIEEQIASILYQVSVSPTIFISVDQSDDITFEICKELSEKYINIIVLPYGEQFGGASKNFFHLIKCVDVSGFDLIAFCDQDDIWLPRKLYRAWSVLNNNVYGAYSSDVIVFGNDKPIKTLKKSYDQTRYDHFFEAAGPGCTYVFNSDTYSGIKSFITHNYEACSNIDLHDWLIYAYCRENCVHWFIDDVPQMLYRQHLYNAVGTNDNLQAYKRRIMLVKSNWYRNQILAISLLCKPSCGTVDFVRRGFIIFNFYKLRRRLRDRVALLVMALVGLF